MPTSSLAQADDVLAEVDRDFRLGALCASAPPTRFYLNLTERCSLSCRHCITSAPDKTASRQARDMGPQVLAALDEHLAHASYVGMPHAGEPLIAPLLVPLLERLRARRQGAPTVVHLLTNGKALTAARFSELAALGVNSWSVSIDGMSAATHDALRTGSRIEELLARLREITAARAARFGDVRIGIAWTLTRDNLAEVEQLLEWAAAAGVDWVKLEELYSCNEVAASLAVEDRVLSVAVRQAEGHAARLGLRLLAHVWPVRARQCKLEEAPRMARFSALDDFANRMSISPCRLPWELVCVEPNGDVRPVSFYHPSSGNLATHSLLELWNGAPFLQARADALENRICPERRPTCARDPGPIAW